MAITTVNPKGQVTIPQPLREKYGFAPGTRVSWVEHDGRLIPQPLLSLKQLRGRLRPGPSQRSLTDALLDERGGDRAREDG